MGSSTQPLHVVLAEPFMGGSHAAWAEGLQHHSRHKIRLLTLPDRHWKWRMHGAAVTLAAHMEREKEQVDLIIATDMLDVATFKALLPKRFQNVPVIVYFHENQLTYPWSATDADVQLKRDRHYGWINYTSALAADAVWFNSAYHRKAFLEALPPFLSAFPDHQNKATISTIEQRSAAVPLGMDFKTNPGAKKREKPLVLWNHRWEYDKNPELFFQTLMQFSEQDISFDLAVCGEAYPKSPKVFNVAREKLQKHIIHWGFAEAKRYHELLSESTHLPVTSNQDFFGIAAVEAMHVGTVPLLPNRLAFPEHLNGAQFSAFYYDTDAGFKQQLQHQLQRPTDGLVIHEMQQQMTRYSWENCIDVYDDRMSKVVEQCTGYRGPAESVNH